MLDVLQVGVPLVERPFLEIGKTLGASEDEVLRRVAAMKGEGGGVIRQISAIFDSGALGYQSTLVAAKVAEEKIDEAAKIINLHPGVSHNYRRNHTFNLWYTLAVPPDSKLGLEKTVEILHRQSGAEVMRMMPTVRTFKIGVKFDLGGTPHGNAVVCLPIGAKPPHYHAVLPLTEKDKTFIRILQQDLPLVAEPSPYGQSKTTCPWNRCSKPVAIFSSVNGYADSRQF